VQWVRSGGRMASRMDGIGIVVTAAD